MLAPPPVHGPQLPPAQYVVLGRSAQGSTIGAIEVGDPSARRKVLVVGCIHGNETAGIAIAGALARRPVPPGVDLWIIPDLNPDGVAADTRQNAHGVDLNRNFPWHWKTVGRKWTPFYSGRRALSEPESRIAYRLIRRLHPSIAIWFHQHLNTVDESGGDVRIESRFAGLAGLPLRRLTRLDGSATTWENHVMPGTTSFVVELPAGSPTAARVARYVRAIDDVAAVPRSS